MLLRPFCRSVQFLSRTSTAERVSAPRLMTSLIAPPSSERAIELQKSLAEVRDRVKHAASEVIMKFRRSDSDPILVAVSKYKSVEDIFTCYQQGQRDFGENYVKELEEKAAALPTDIRWHFIGSLQSNKCKTIAAIPNIFAVQTLDSVKKATALNNGLPEGRTEPLHVFIQINTSGEDSKSGLQPIDSTPSSPSPSEQTTPSSEVIDLAIHILKSCPRLHLQGLMTIGSIEQSKTAANEAPNKDFESLVQTSDALENALRILEEGDTTGTALSERWGGPGGRGRLELSMGMSSDFESAIRSGAGTVRVGTGIFGARKMKE